MAPHVAFVGWEEQGASIAAADGEEFGVGAAGGADRGFDVERRGVEFRVAEAVDGSQPLFFGAASGSPWS